MSNPPPPGRSGGVPPYHYAPARYFDRHLPLASQSHQVSSGHQQALLQHFRISPPPVSKTPRFSSDNAPKSLEVTVSEEREESRGKEVAEDNNPWVSGEVLANKLRKKVAETGSPVDVMSQARRQAYITGEMEEPKGIQAWGADQPPSESHGAEAPSVSLRAKSTASPKGTDSGWPAPHPDEEARDWDKGALLQDWASKVSSIAPPDGDATPLHHSRPSSTLPSRPDSRPQTPKPQIVYCFDSDTERSAPSPVLPTPEDDKAMRSSLPRPPPVLSIGFDNRLDNSGGPGDQAVRRTHDSRRQPKVRGIDTHSPRDDVVGEERQGGAPVPAFRPRGEFWKRPPSMMFSPRFANRRLLIRFPFPVRAEVAIQSVKIHFARYGTVKKAFYHEKYNESCEKAFVVFEDEASLQACLQDPKKGEFEITSGHGQSRLDVVVERPSPHEVVRAIFVRLTGSRPGARTRSASPVHRRERPQPHSDTQAAVGHSKPHNQYFDTQPIPEKVVVYAYPHVGKFTERLRYWARVLEPDMTMANVQARAQAETNHDSFLLAEVDMTINIPEKDIVPRLCDYFGEICDVLPPTDLRQGWLITVAGPQDARRMMDELSRIPGVTTRWAKEGDGRISTHSSPPDNGNQHLSPLTRLDKFVEGPVARAGGAHSHQNSLTRALDLDLKKRVHQYPNVAASVRTATNSVRRLSLAASHRPSMRAWSSHAPSLPPSPPAQFEPGGQHPYHPSLHRSMLYTYKGRVLNEVEVDGEIKYFDRAAIFVGRLVKGQETKETLFARFSQYGIICNIEYNPLNTESTYATARILYQIPEAAKMAIDREHGATSFGSGIKVEERKVLLADVQMKEMYIDPSGRALSPSDVSQYSPPAGSHEAWEEAYPSREHMPSQEAWEEAYPSREHMPSHPYTYPSPYHCRPPPPPHLLQAGLSPMPHVMFGYGPPPRPYPPTPPQNSTGGPGQPGLHGPMLPPTMMPVPTMGMIGSGQAAQTAGGHMVPMIHCMGMNYYPQAWMGGMPYQSVLPNPSPPHSPDRSYQPTIYPTTTSDAPAHQADTKDDVPATPPAQSFPDPQTEQDVSETILQRSPIKIKGMIFEHGVYKVIYDEADLKRYRDEKGLPLPAKKDTEDVTRKEVELPAIGTVTSDGLFHYTRIEPAITKPTTGKEEERLVSVPIPFNPPNAPSTAPLPLIQSANQQGSRPRNDEGTGPGREGDIRPMANNHEGRGGFGTGSDRASRRDMIGHEYRRPGYYEPNGPPRHGPQKQDTRHQTRHRYRSPGDQYDRPERRDDMGQRDRRSVRV